MEKPIIVEIEKTIDEADGIRTIFIKHAMDAKPGQFIMVWIPEIDEKPFAISYLEKDRIGITVSAIGPFSKALYNKKLGDRIGIRGPYGKEYTLEKNNLIMIGGGYGSASLTLLAEEALKEKMNVKFILGARSKNKLVYVERIKKLIGEENLIITTDDGSQGKKGFVTDALKELIKNETVEKVFACGPDKMMKAVAQLCVENNIHGEVSMERWMKCGFGLCGHCCMDPSGVRVCIEGPVMNFKDSLKLTEFGEYHRVQSSRKEKL